MQCLEVRRTTKSMASIVTAKVIAPAGDDRAEAKIERAIRRAFAEFQVIERHCSRFDDGSALMRANRRPCRWHRAPEALYSLVVEAVAAHERTAGMFDPRIHDRLVELGYDRSFHLLPPAQAEPASRAEPASPGGCSRPVANPAGPEWRPGSVPVLRLINLRGARIDLGGIGKGMAVRRAAHRLRSAAANFLIDAGGDLYAAGSPPDTPGWRVGVESPWGSDRPVAVLEVSDKAVATSSVRIRNWKRGDRQVHHLIDPRTGEPGGDGLVAVTVIDADPVGAETSAKSLFLSGSASIYDQATAIGLPVLWVRADGTIGTSAAADPFVIWTDE